MAFSTVLNCTSLFTTMAFKPAATTTITTLSHKTKATNTSSSHNPRPKYTPNRVQDTSYVRIFDTTLRDGEQTPRVALTGSDKLIIARQLAKLGVDVIEAGFPASSESEFEAVKAIAKDVGNVVDETGYVPVICVCARCTRRDIDVAWEAVKYAKRARVVTFIATSDIHLEYKLKKSREEVLSIVEEMVSYVSSLGCLDIGFVCEDAGRSEKEFLYKVYEAAIKAGATTITFTDTVGYNVPIEVSQIIADIKANVTGIQNVVLSVHCHNDLGLATANTLAAVNSGARQVEVTVNGIGERAGNAALEEIVMAINCRGKDVLGGVYTGINTKQITPTSKMVEEYSRLYLQPNKAIVGVNVFSHSSGIHQDGTLKYKGTYQILSPEDIGLSASSNNGIVLGKLSGRHAFKSRLLEMGFNLQEEEIDEIFSNFKAVVEKEKYLTDKDIESLVHKSLAAPLKA